VTGDPPLAAPAPPAGSIPGVCLLNLLFLVGIALWFRPERPSELHGLSLIVEIVLGLGVLAAVLTGRRARYTVLAWKNSYWGIAGRSYYTLVTSRGRFCLVPELLELVGLAVLVDQRFKNRMEAIMKRLLAYLSIIAMLFFFSSRRRPSLPRN